MHRTGQFPDLLAAHAAETANYLEKRLADHIHAPSHLAEAMRYAVLNGGKRFRPFLVMESARLFDTEYKTAIPVAAALECIHCYSLVHDDLPAMDNDDMRRGKPTVHIAFDEATAILAGDSLLTFAFEILGEKQTHPDAETRSTLILELAKASGWNGMAGGQALDLRAESMRHPRLADVERIQSLKTGALIRYACEAGAILGGAKEEQRRALACYGENLGYAFQIADDLLDVEGDAETTGKATAKDRSAGKATLVSILGVREARLKLAELQKAAVESLDIFGERAASLADAVHFAVNRKY